MKKALHETMAKVRVISGSKGSGSVNDIQNQAQKAKDKFKNRIKSATKSTANDSQVRVPVNDEKISKDL